MLLARYQRDLLEAGCDEAGRGCLAGPVFAAAVILPPRFKHKLLNDSKQLSEDVRYELRKEIEKKAIAFAVASVDNEEIDQDQYTQRLFPGDAPGDRKAFNGSPVFDHRW